MLEFKMKPPYIPDVSNTNYLNNTKNKYLEKLTQVIY